MSKLLRLFFTCLILIIPGLISCGGGGSSSGSYGPPQGSTDPADIVASIRYQNANITYSQSATVFAKVFDVNGNRVPDGTPVRFTLNEKNITKESQAGKPLFSNGTTTFDTATVNGFCSGIVNYFGVLEQASSIATVTIRPLGFIQVYENVDIIFFSNASVSYGLVLTTDKSTVPGDGISKTTIIARILNSFGEPPQTSGILVTFTLSPSEAGTLSAGSARTNDQGEASVTYTSEKVSSPISVIVTATATVPVAGFSSGVSVSDIITIGLTPQVIGSIVVNAEPTTIYTYGIEDDATTPNNSTITATVFDENGVPLIDDTLIKFTAVDRDTREPIGIIPPFAFTTSTASSGVATVEFKAGFKAGIAEITATDSSGIVSGTTYVVVKTDFAFGDCAPSIAGLNADYLFDLNSCMTGGTPPYSFELVPDGGTLPPGLTLDGATGLVTGKASQEGTFLFSILASDSFGNTAQQNMAIVVVEGFDIITGGIAKVVNFSAGGGANFNWTISYGSVAPSGGFSFIPNGSTAQLIYTGQPLTSGGAITVQVTVDANPPKTFVVIVNK